MSGRPVKFPQSENGTMKRDQIHKLSRDPDQLLTTSPTFYRKGQEKVTIGYQYEYNQTKTAILFH